MASKKGERRVQVRLECTSCRTSETPGVHRYHTVKNKKNTPGRLELNKYCPNERKVTAFKEVK